MVLVFKVVLSRYGYKPRFVSCVTLDKSLRCDYYLNRISTASEEAALWGYHLTAFRTYADAMRFKGTISDINDSDYVVLMCEANEEDIIPSSDLPHRLCIATASTLGTNPRLGFPWPSNTIMVKSLTPVKIIGSLPDDQVDTYIKEYMKLWKESHTQPTTS